MEAKQDRGVASSAKPPVSERENALCLVAADLEAAICKLDNLGLLVAAARVGHGLEVVKAAIQNLENGDSN
ncbi:MAG: hypothetical protein ACKOPG_10460 [Novosphingobium sp.]